MKYYYLLILLGLVVGCAAVPEPAKEPPCKLEGGVEEPDMSHPPYVYVQPPGDHLWYPAGQCRTDEEIGKHGH